MPRPLPVSGSGWLPPAGASPLFGLRANSEAVHGQQARGADPVLTAADRDAGQLVEFLGPYMARSDLPTSAAAWQQHLSQIVTTNKGAEDLFSQVRTCGDEENRTLNPRLAKAVLCQLSYVP